MIEILMVDDHPIFRSGVRRLLSDEPDMRVVAEANDGSEALLALRQQTFSVVLLDINMGGRTGLDTLRRIRTGWPKLPVIMLSMYPPENYGRISLEAGANGYLAKDCDAMDLTAAIRVVARGGCFLPPGMPLCKPSDPEQQPIRQAHQCLTDREWEVLRLMVKGMSLTDIGERLCLSVKTIGSHRSRLLAKLNLTSNADLVRYCLLNNISD